MQNSTSEYVISLWLFSNLLSPAIFCLSFFFDGEEIEPLTTVYTSMLIIGLVFSIPLLAAAYCYMRFLIYLKAGNVITIAAWVVGLLSMTALFLFIIWKAFFGVAGEIDLAYWYVTGSSFIAIALMILFRLRTLLQLVERNRQELTPEHPYV